MWSETMEVSKLLIIFQRNLLTLLFILKMAPICS
jgi:hypothetical protein